MYYVVYFLHIGNSTNNFKTFLRSMDIYYEKRDGLNSKKELLKKTITTCPFQVAMDKMILWLHLQRDEPALPAISTYMCTSAHTAYSQVFFSVWVRDDDYYWSLDEKARFDDFNVYPCRTYTYTLLPARIYVYVEYVSKAYTHTHTYVYIYIYI